MYQKSHLTISPHNGPFNVSLKKLDELSIFAYVMLVVFWKNLNFVGASRGLPRALKGIIKLLWTL